MRIFIFSLFAVFILSCGNKSGPDNNKDLLDTVHATRTNNRPPVYSEIDFFEDKSKLRVGLITLNHVIDNSRLRPQDGFDNDYKQAALFNIPRIKYETENSISFADIICVPKDTTRWFKQVKHMEDSLKRADKTLNNKQNVFEQTVWTILNDIHFQEKFDIYAFLNIPETTDRFRMTDLEIYTPIFPCTTKIYKKSGNKWQLIHTEHSVDWFKYTHLTYDLAVFKKIRLLSVKQ